MRCESRRLLELASLRASFFDSPLRSLLLLRPGALLDGDLLSQRFEVSRDGGEPAGCFRHAQFVLPRIEPDERIPGFDLATNLELHPYDAPRDWSRDRPRRAVNFQPCLLADFIEGNLCQYAPGKPRAEESERHQYTGGATVEAV